MDDPFDLQAVAKSGPAFAPPAMAPSRSRASMTFCSLKPKLWPGAGQKAAKSGWSGPVRWRTKPASPALCTQSSFMFS